MSSVPSEPKMRVGTSVEVEREPGEVKRGLDLLPDEEDDEIIE